MYQIYGMTIWFTNENNNTVLISKNSHILSVSITLHPEILGIYWGVIFRLENEVLIVIICKYLNISWVWDVIFSIFCALFLSNECYK